MDQLFALLKFIFDEVSISTFILFLVTVFCFMVGIRAQTRKDFDFADMLRDNNGKLSSVRLAATVCLLLTSWVLIYVTLSKGRDDATLIKVFEIYMLVWSGSKVLERLIDAWISSKGFGTLKTTTDKDVTTTMVVSPLTPKSIGSSKDVEVRAQRDTDEEDGDLTNKPREDK